MADVTDNIPEEGDQLIENVRSINSENRAAELDDVTEVEQSRRDDEVVKKPSCCMGLKQRQLFICYILVIVVGILMSGVMVFQRNMSYGQCIVGMRIFDDGLLTRSMDRYWCRCPLYIIVLSSGAAWVAIMINWVSDLRSKHKKFCGWLKCQVGVACAGTALTLGALTLTVVGFTFWCLHLEDTMSAPLCYKAADLFDVAHPGNFVKMRDAFYYTLIIMVLAVTLVTCWVVAVVYTVKMLRETPMDILQRTRNPSVTRSESVEPLIPT